MKYARIENGLVAEIVDVSGNIADRYHPSLTFEPIPDGVVPVPGWSWSEAHGFQEVPSDVERVRTAALKSVDTSAEAARTQFITPGAGQAMTYQQKEAEADAIVNDATPDETDYPFLAACLGVDGDTLMDVAAVVRARRETWEVIGAEIERRRLQAKHAISNAITTPEIETILSNLTWPQPE